MTELTEETPVPTHEDAIFQLLKSLINSIAVDSEDAHGGNPRERLKNQIKFRTDEKMVGAIGALSAYLQARSANRQADALEALARSASALQLSGSSDTSAQAIVDLRESKRDYLAATYSLPTQTLSLLWAMRGMLMDASIKSLSKPDRFDPYRRLSTEEIAWSLRLTSEQLWEMLPRHADGIDFELLEDFDILHYNDNDVHPDDWLYGG